MSPTDNEVRWRELRACKRDGRFIDGIKTIRAQSGMGLKEAKDAMERYRDTGDEKEVKALFLPMSDAPSAQLAFENGTVVFMPSTQEIKVNGIFTTSEWKNLVNVVAALDPNWA